MRGGKRKNAGRKPLGGEKKQTLSVRLPPDVIAWLDKAADDAGQSRAEVIESALREYLGDLASPL